MAKEKNIQVIAENFIFKKDDISFKFLFERLRPGVLNHCFAILNDLELAEDAFLNSMAKVWQKIDQYDVEKGNFSTWCYNIAKNESLLLQKSRKKLVNKTSEEIELDTSKMDPDSVIYSVEDDPIWSFLSGKSDIDAIYDQLVDQIKDLPILYRDIMIDREINGMKYKDIADKYGIKKRSIATRIRRARTKIKKKIEDLTKKIEK